MNPLIRFLKERFNLQEDKASEAEIIASVGRGVELRGTNLWVLIFAIFIASLGLNTNSTAVIIGAMLISPLMGPITGIGLALGINDLALLRKAAKNLAFATLVSIATSALYFIISPLDEARSELLSRTSPSTWDVLIAFFGGLAGMVASTRREKGNVVAGVAIATALMPPLCTVGFGLANQQWLFAVGAFYLYFINSVFICLAALIITRYLNFQRKHASDPAKERRNRMILAAVAILAILPSIYLTYEIVQRNVFEAAAQRFVDREIQLDGVQVVRQTATFNHGKKALRLVLIGRSIDSAEVDTLRARMHTYAGMSGTRLHLRQGFTTNEPLDMDKIKVALLNELMLARTRQDSIRRRLAPTRLLEEASVWQPKLAKLSYQDVISHDSATKPDTLALVSFRAKPALSDAEAGRVKRWLQARLLRDSIILLAEPGSLSQSVPIIRVPAKQRLRRRRK